MFHVASEDDIKKGKVTDVYFERGVKVLKEKKLDKFVKAEVRAANLPADWQWAVLAGIEELAELLKDHKVNVYAMPEGTIFHPEEPVVVVSGNYTDFAVFETSLLGLLCQASGVATKAARCKLAAGERAVYSFGARRMHPAIAPIIERNAFIGGCDGVATTESAELIGEKPIGTMAHALILVFGDEMEAFKAFDEVMPPEVRRTALIDTFEDEKFGAIKAAESLGKKLFAVRLDTPGSRRGNFLKILQEVRWELDLRGYDYVKIFVSGGVDEYKVLEYNPFVDAYGIGTAISNAPVVDFSLDIVEIEGESIAKRGKMSGGKQVFRCEKCYEYHVAPMQEGWVTCTCGGKANGLIQSLLKEGGVVTKLPRPQEIRKYLLDQLKRFALTI